MYAGVHTVKNREPLYSDDKGVQTSLLTFETNNCVTYSAARKVLHLYLYSITSPTFCMPVQWPGAGEDFLEDV
jgi:hypothetical protein